MNKKTTLKFLKNFSLKNLLSAITIIASCNSYAQLLYSNGPISTGATHIATSTAAPAGYTWSELQTPGTSIGFSGFYNNALTSNFALAEDFVVPVGQTWNLTNVNVYGYQTSFAGATVPIDVLRIRIWNGDPSLGTSTVVYGDMTTNVLNAAGSGEEFVYRVATTTGTTRKVWRFNAAITTSLTAGTYWIEYQVHAINDASVFVPPVTILGTQSDPSWTAKQRNAATWAGMIDAGSTFNKSIPFQLIDSSLGLNSNELASSFKMYPMPVRDICNFKLNENTLLEANSVSIYDLKGSLVLNKKIIKNGSDFSINVSNLEAGMYLVKIIDVEGKSIFTNKLIKE
jgi:hypothetical protein